MKRLPQLLLLAFLTVALAGCKKTLNTSIDPQDAPETFGESQETPSTDEASIPPFPSLPAGWTQVNHPEGFFIVALPESWKSSTTELVGEEETGFSAQSPDLKAFPDGKYDGPLTYVSFVTGAKLDITTSEGEAMAQAEPAGTIYETREIDIAGQKGIFRSFKEQATTQGQFMEARVAVSNTSYRLVMGYNPESFPEGKAVFDKIVASFRPSGFVPSNSTPQTTSGEEVKLSPIPTDLKTE